MASVVSGWVDPNSPEAARQNAAAASVDGEVRGRAAAPVGKGDGAVVAPEWDGDVGGSDVVSEGEDDESGSAVVSVG